jgi:hypothetical protein
VTLATAWSRHSRQHGRDTRDSTVATLTTAWS